MTAAGAPLVIIGGGTALLTIVDNEFGPGVLSFSSPTFSASETNATAVMGGHHWRISGESKRPLSAKVRHASPLTSISVKGMWARKMRASSKRVTK